MIKKAKLSEAGQILRELQAEKDDLFKRCASLKLAIRRIERLNDNTSRDIDISILCRDALESDDE